MFGLGINHFDWADLEDMLLKPPIAKGFFIFAKMRRGK